MKVCFRDGLVEKLFSVKTFHKIVKKVCMEGRFRKGTTYSVQ